jgi:hypothetical protein
MRASFYGALVAKPIAFPDDVEIHSFRCEVTMTLCAQTFASESLFFSAPLRTIQIDD